MHAGIGPRCGHDFRAADGTFGLCLRGRPAAAGLSAERHEDIIFGKVGTEAQT
jgi:hypothetical protein